MNKNVTVTVQDSDGVAQSISVITATWEREMRETGEFSISVKNDQGETSQPNFDLIVGSDGNEGHKNRSVIISEGGVEKFHGIIDHTNIRNSEIVASGRGNVIKLAWRKRQTLLEQTATPADDVFDTLLTSHDDITQDATDRITTNISVLYPKGENDYINIYATVFNYLNAECEVTTDDVLHVKSSLGTDKSATTILAFGTNIIAVEREVDSFEIANNIEVTSFSEGTFQLTAGPTSDATSVAAYGQRDLFVPARNATFQDEIDNRLMNLLASEKDPKDSISDVLFLDDSGDDLQIGDTVTVTNARLGLSGTYRIFRLAYAWSSSGYFTMATMSNIFRTSSKQIANLSHRLDIERIYPQGSPMLVGVGFPLYALDVDKDLEYRFDIPDDTDWNVVIHRAKISIDLDAYRSWQKTGQSTTHDHIAVLDNTHLHETTGWDEKFPSTVLQERAFIETVPTSWADVEGQSWDPVLDTGLSIATLIIKNGSGGNELFRARLDVGGTFYPSSSGQEQNIDNGNVGIFEFIWYMSSGNDESDVSIQWETDSSGGADVDYNLHVQKLGRWRTDTGAHGHSVSTGGAHTHPVDHGITETNNFPEDIIIRINGTDRFGYIGSGATNESAAYAGGSKTQIRNIDIKDYLTVGENTLLFKSTGTGSLGMIAMHGLVRIFAQSRA